jgi:hypothetical protein
MSRCRMVPASLIHVGPLARRMRAVDQAECRAFGYEPKAALRHSLAASMHAWTALAEDGEPLCMLGVQAISLVSSRGSPWLLGTDRLFDYPRDLVLLAPYFIWHWHRTFRVLENNVSADNDRAIRLLRKWGAMISDEPFKQRGLEFLRFRFERPAIQARLQAA